MYESFLLFKRLSVKTGFFAGDPYNRLQITGDFKDILRPF